MVSSSEEEPSLDDGSHIGGITTILRHSGKQGLRFVPGGGGERSSDDGDESPEWKTLRHHLRQRGRPCQRCFKKWWDCLATSVTVASVAAAKGTGTENTRANSASVKGSDSDGSGDDSILSSYLVKSSK